MDDQARFLEMFERTYSAVARYAYHRGLRGPDAEDLVAATFEVAWRRIETVPDGEQATPWLLVVARNLSRNTYRRARRQRLLTNSLIELDDQSSVRSVEDGVIAREQLQEALAALKELDRELILLVAWDGLDPAQAGRVIGLRPGAARSRLHRARLRLAALVDRQAGLPRGADAAAAPALSTPSIRPEDSP